MHTHLRLGAIALAATLTLDSPLLATEAPAARTIILVRHGSYVADPKTGATGIADKDLIPPK